MKYKTNAQEKLDEKLDKAVNTPTGKQILRHLIDGVGVSKGLRFYNDVEKRAPKKLCSALKPFIVERVFHTHGLVFKNGLTIKHVDKSVFSYATQDVCIEDVKERLPRNNFVKI